MQQLWIMYHSISADLLMHMLIVYYHVLSQQHLKIEDMSFLSQVLIWF